MFRGFSGMNLPLAKNIIPAKAFSQNIGPTQRHIYAINAYKMNKYARHTCAPLIYAVNTCVGLHIDIYNQYICNEYMCKAYICS